MRLLCGCCSVATRLRCCDCKRLVLHTAEQGGRGGPCKHIMAWWTSLSWRSARSAGPACQQVAFKLRDYPELNLKDIIQKEQLGTTVVLRLSSRRRQMIVIQCITVNFAQIMTWIFTGEDLAEECFPSGCCLQHYANTDTSKMQLTIEEAKGAQS